MRYLKDTANFLEEDAGVFLQFLHLVKYASCNVLAQRKFAIWHAYTTENSASFEIWNTTVAFVDRVLCVIASASKMMILPVEYGKYGRKIINRTTKSYSIGLKAS